MLSFTILDDIEAEDNALCAFNADVIDPTAAVQYFIIKSPFYFIVLMPIYDMFRSLVTFFTQKITEVIIKTFAVIFLIS